MSLNLLNKFFPPPKFISCPAVGVDISEESIKFVELTNTRKGVRLGRYGEKEIPVGAIESGKIVDKKKIEEVLISLKKEQNIKTARVSLPEEQIYLFQIELEKESLESIREGIELSLEEHVPIPAPEVVFDYEILSESENMLELQVVAISQSIVNDYLTVFDNAGISVFAFELEAQAIVRAVVKKGDRGTHMVVDFGKKRAGVSIISDGALRFTSTVDVGGVLLTNVIQKNFKISFKEAEKMKKKYGLGRDAENKEMFSVLLNGVSVLRDEISRHLLFWHTNRDEHDLERASIQKIILCGGDSNLIGFPEYLSVSMKIKIELANVWVNIDNLDSYIPEMDFKQSLSYATAIGLALGNFEK